jgi:SNF2 family DNA or RNA helicase
VAVTTYETTGFLLHDDLKISMLVVDEAHYIKNPDAKRTRNTRKLCDQAERLLFMTGTALENRVDEMIALMQILRPEVAVDVKNVAFLASAPQFREKVSPVYFRRKRDEVLGELPDLIENMEWCALGPEEEAVYKEAILSDHFQNARRVSWSVDDLSLSSKARRLQEIVEDAAEDGRKIIVFSFFLNTISKVSALLGNRCVDPITGSVSPKRRQEIIDEFEKAPAGAVLPAQILAGGTGLNIQAASVVVICEPQLKPSIENQAISRAYRMGQARNVLVYRLLADETIDERITDLLNEKQIRFDAFADESVLGKESIQIDETGIKEIMEEEKQRILNT